MDVNNWAEKVRQGEPRALARALSEVENRGPDGAPLLRILFPYSGKGWRIGVTGAPGAGKSTLVDRMTAHLRHDGRRVAIVAIDPTSPFSGGSVLGDRVRMQAHYSDPGVFIRSMASRGPLGGLAPQTADLLLVLEAAGYDAVLIETVGVGQAEVDIVQLAPVVALVLTPSMGDHVQTMKAGIMEIAGVFVINKADQPGADRIESELEGLLSLSQADKQPRPAIVRTVATEGEGVPELLSALQDCPTGKQHEVDYWRTRLAEMIRERLSARLFSAQLSEQQLRQAAQDVARKALNPYEFAASAVEEFLSGTR